MGEMRVGCLLAIVCCSLLLCLAEGAHAHDPPGYIRPAVLPLAVVTTPVPRRPRGGMPAHFDWRDQLMLTPIMNQFLPKWCGSCWAMAVASSLSDRIAIMRGAKAKTQVQLSPQILLDCGAYLFTYIHIHVHTYTHLRAHAHATHMHTQRAHAHTYALSQ
jgi:hypothetical protein